MWYDPLNSFNPIFIDQDITLKPLEGKNDQKQVQLVILSRLADTFTR